jgi:hypothetical protein
MAVRLAVRGKNRRGYAGDTGNAEKVGNIGNTGIREIQERTSAIE